MSDCASICEILISHWILRGLEMKYCGWGNAEKKRDFSSALPQGDYAMLITLASEQLVRKHNRENTNPEYNQCTGFDRMVSYSTTSE